MIFAIDKKNSAHTALYTADQEMSYGELTEAVSRFETHLNGRNLAFCLCKNTMAAVIGYLGILDQGSVPLLLDEQMEEEQIKKLYDIYAPGILWLPEEKADRWQRVLPGRIRYRDRGYVLLEPDTAPQVELHEDLALLLTTSGSTGSPKLVRLSRENICSNAASILEYLEITEKERAITTLPMHYTYGLSVLHSHLLAGAGIILTEQSVVQEDFWRLLADRKATSLSGVPYTYQLLNRLRLFEEQEDPAGAAGLYGNAYRSLRTLTQAGGKLPEELQKKAALWSKKRQIRFFIMYGQTEATARMGYLPAESCLDKTGSLGIAIPGGRFWLADELHQEIHKPGVAGELYYQGPNVSLGYARRREDLARGDERGGILATGDLAQFDEDGYFYIVGRKSRFVKLYGRRIGLDSCEKILADAWGQEEAAEFVCVGSDSKIQVACTQQQAAEWAVPWLMEHLDLPRKAVEGLWLPQIPRNHQGKTDYHRIEALYLEKKERHTR